MAEVAELPVESIHAGAPNRIRELRLKAGLTQKELGMLVGKTGFVVSRHERETRRIAHETLLKYAAAFKVFTYELFHKPIRTGEDTSWHGEEEMPVILEDKARRER